MSNAEPKLLLLLWNTEGPNFQSHARPDTKEKIDWLHDNGCTFCSLRAPLDLERNCGNKRIFTLLRMLIRHFYDICSISGFPLIFIVAGCACCKKFHWECSEASNYPLCNCFAIFFLQHFQVLVLERDEASQWSSYICNVWLLWL